MPLAGDGVRAERRRERAIGLARSGKLSASGCGGPVQSRWTSGCYPLAMTLRLITIGPSHYCEKARWGLERLGVPFVEEPHPPLFHVLVVRRHGGRRTVPLLVTPDGPLADSTDILQALDRQVGGGPLYPEDPELRREVEELEDVLDEQLGPHVRRLAYHHLLWDPRMPDVMTRGVRRPGERALFRVSLPLVRRAMARFLRLTAAGAARSRERVHEVFRQVDERLADGRAHLVGGRFTAADLTFAALAAPLLMPPEYGWPLPPLDEAPAALRAEVEPLRATRAGRFALELYRTERRVRAR